MPVETKSPLLRDSHQRAWISYKCSIKASSEMLRRHNEGVVMVAVMEERSHES